VTRKCGKFQPLIAFASQMPGSTIKVRNCLDRSSWFLILILLTPRQRSWQLRPAHTKRNVPDAAPSRRLCYLRYSSLPHVASRIPHRSHGDEQVSVGKPPLTSLNGTRENKIQYEVSIRLRLRLSRNKNPGLHVVLHARMQRCVVRCPR
jgi:hypothetical protein